MTCDEHMYLKSTLQDLRDTLEAHRGAVQAEAPRLVVKLEMCLRVLGRPSVLQALTGPEATPHA